MKKTKKLNAAQRAAIACAVHGHPRVKTACFGYISCARCDAQVGDTLGGSYDTSEDVIVGHDCAACRKNARQLTRKELTFLPKEVRDELRKLGAAA